MGTPRAPLTALRAALWLCLASACGAAVFNVRDFGARGDGVTADTAAIRAALRAAADAGGGTVQFPAGRYLTAPFNLTSHVRVEVDDGATVLGVQDEAQYPVIPPLPTYGVSRDGGLPLRHQALIMATEARNVTITGAGTIDGQGAYWWNLSRQKLLKAGRPRLIEWYNCSGVELSSVTVTNPGFWTLHPVYSRDVWIHHVNVTNDLGSPNTDGVDPDSSVNVLVEHCFVTCGDDFVAIKSGLNAAGLRYNLSVANVTVRYNHFASGHGISIGSETSGGVRDIFIHDNVVDGPASHGLQIKTAPARGNVIEGVHFWNNRVAGVHGDVLVILSNYDAAPPAPVLPVIRNVTYANITGSDSLRAGTFDCLPASPCTDIRLENIAITATTAQWTCQHVRNGSAVGVSPPGLQQCFDAS